MWPTTCENMCFLCEGWFQVVGNRGGAWYLAAVGTAFSMSTLGAHGQTTRRCVAARIPALLEDEKTNSCEQGCASVSQCYTSGQIEDDPLPTEGVSGHTLIVSCLDFRNQNTSILAKEDTQHWGRGPPVAGPHPRLHVSSIPSITMHIIPTLTEIMARIHD